MLYSCTAGAVHKGATTPHRLTAGRGGRWWRPHSAACPLGASPKHTPSSPLKPARGECRAHQFTAIREGQHALQARLPSTLPLSSLRPVLSVPRSTGFIQVGCWTLSHSENADAPQPCLPTAHHHTLQTHSPAACSHRIGSRGGSGRAGRRAPPAPTPGSSSPRSCCTAVGPG